MQVGSGDTWTQVSETLFCDRLPTFQGGGGELGHWMRQVSLPRSLLPRLQAEGLDRQDHQGLLRSVFNHCARMRAVKSGVNGILYCDKWSGESSETINTDFTFVREDISDKAGFS